jgi:hypothetical protein
MSTIPRFRKKKKVVTVITSYTSIHLYIYTSILYIYTSIHLYIYTSIHVHVEIPEIPLQQRLSSSVDRDVEKEEEGGEGIIKKRSSF